MTEKVVYNDPNPIDESKTYTPKELADFVRHKMYGKDVREAIALAIENMPSNIDKPVDYGVLSGSNITKIIKIMADYDVPIGLDDKGNVIKTD